MWDMVYGIPDNLNIDEETSQQSWCSSIFIIQETFYQIPPSPGMQGLIDVSGHKHTSQWN